MDIGSVKVGDVVRFKYDREQRRAVERIETRDGEKVLIVRAEYDGDMMMKALWADDVFGIFPK